MKPLNKATLRGTWGAVLLPLNSDDSIDYGRLEAELATLVSAGLDGVYTNGTAGEFHTQTEHEFDRISHQVADIAERHRLPFQIGACHSSAQITLARVQRAKELRPGAIQVVLPDWLPVGEQEAVAFLERVAEAAAPIGLVLYNPPHAKRTLRLDEIARLRAAVPALIGIKVGDGPASWYAAMRRQLPEVAVFVPGHHLATGTMAGAHGSYSNVACLHPRGAARWHRLMQTEPIAALEVEQRLLGFLQENLAPLAAQGFSGAALDKLLCAIGGWADVGLRLRWPYKFIPAEVAEKLRPIARRSVPELFDL